MYFILLYNLSLLLCSCLLKYNYFLCINIVSLLLTSNLEYALEYISLNFFAYSGQYLDDIYQDPDDSI